MKPIRKRIVFCLLAVSFFFLVNSNWVIAGSQCIFPTVTADPQTQEDWYLKWDPENPDVTDQDGITTIAIKGSRPPFTWSVSENGFTLEDSETSGVSNTLYDGTGCNNCEVAEITVADEYGASITGYVRCQNGTWKECYNFQFSGCSGCNCEGSYELEGHAVSYVTCQPGWGGDVDLSWECYCTENGGDGWGGVRTPTIEDVPYYCNTYVDLFRIKLFYWGCPDE